MLSSPSHSEGSSKDNALRITAILRGSCSIFSSEETVRSGLELSSRCPCFWIADVCSSTYRTIVRRSLAALGNAQNCACDVSKIFMQTRSCCLCPNGPQEGPVGLLRACTVPAYITAWQLRIRRERGLVSSGTFEIIKRSKES